MKSNQITSGKSSWRYSWRLFATVSTPSISSFSIYRVQSLESLGLREGLALSSRVYTLNMHIMLGGILLDVIGDKLGRLQVLFGSRGWRHYNVGRRDTPEA